MLMPRNTGRGGEAQLGGVLRRYEAADGAADEWSCSYYHSSSLILVVVVIKEKEEALFFL